MGEIELRPHGNSSVPPPLSASPTNSDDGDVDSDGLLGRSRARVPPASAVWLKARVDGARRVPWRVPATIGLCVVVGVVATASYLASQAEVHQNQKDAQFQNQKDAQTVGPDAPVVRTYATATSPPPPPPPVPPLRVLFVGNSFTYGPPSKDEPHGDTLYNLPAMFALIARSKGVAVEVGEDTLGG